MGPPSDASAHYRRLPLAERGHHSAALLQGQRPRPDQEGALEGGPELPPVSSPQEP